MELQDFVMNLTSEALIYLAFNWKIDKCKLSEDLNFLALDIDYSNDAVHTQVHINTCEMCVTTLQCLHVSCYRFSHFSHVKSTSRPI